MTVLIAAVAVESYFALFAPVEFHRPPPKQHANNFSRMHCAATTPGLEYELEPDSAVEVMVWDTVVHINRWGMRGPDIPKAKGEDVFRIAVVGDSFTFGHGVPDDATLPFQMEEILAERVAKRAEDGASPARYEVLNFGVSGYSSRDAELVVRHKIGAFDPDLIVLAYVLNDPDAHSSQPVHLAYHKPRLWERFHVTRLLAESAEERAVKQHGGWFRYLHESPKPWSTVVEGFEGIRETASRMDLPVLLVAMPLINVHSWEHYSLADLHDQVLGLGEEMGFLTLDLRKPLSDLVRRPQKLKLEDGSHANRMGNRLFARGILQCLAEHFPEDFSGLGLRSDPPVSRSRGRFARRPAQGPAAARR